MFINHIQFDMLHFIAQFPHSLVGAFRLLHFHPKNLSVKKKKRQEKKRKEKIEEKVFERLQGMK